MALGGTEAILLDREFVSLMTWNFDLIRGLILVMATLLTIDSGGVLVGSSVRNLLMLLFRILTNMLRMLPFMRLERLSLCVSVQMHGWNLIFRMILAISIV